MEMKCISIDVHRKATVQGTVRNKLGVIST
jgi:hypothetical protein